MPKRTGGSQPEPEIVEMAQQTMAVVYTRGDPNDVGPQAMPALYGSVYTLKVDQKNKGGEAARACLRMMELRKTLRLSQR